MYLCRLVLPPSNGTLTVLLFPPAQFAKFEKCSLRLVYCALWLRAVVILMINEFYNTQS